jgi:hypothetical protein
MFSFIACGISDFITSLKFEDFQWILGLLLLVLFCLVLIWGSKLDTSSPRLTLWDLGHGALGSSSRGYGLCGFDYVGHVSNLCGSSSLGFGLHGSTW